MLKFLTSFILPSLVYRVKPVMRMVNISLQVLKCITRTITIVNVKQEHKLVLSFGDSYIGWKGFPRIVELLTMVN